MTVPAKTSVVVRMTLAPNKLEMIAPKVGRKSSNKIMKNIAMSSFVDLRLLRWTRVAR